MERECPVCLGAIAEHACVTECGHAFHSACIFRSIGQDPRCPMCRQDLVARSVEADATDDAARRREQARVVQSYALRRRRLETREADVRTLRDEWLQAEVTYSRLDGAMASVLQSIVTQALTTARVKDTVARRDVAQRSAQRLKVRYRRMLERRLQEAPPTGMLDRVLARHVRAELRRLDESPQLPDDDEAPVLPDDNEQAADDDRPEVE